MKNKKILWLHHKLCAPIGLALIILFAATACTKEVNRPIRKEQTDTDYTVEQFQRLTITPEIEGVNFLWKRKINEKQSAPVWEGKIGILYFETPGVETVTCIGIDENNTRISHQDYTITVTKCPEGKYSPYIAKVIDFQPAPGQFINDSPTYEDVETYEQLINKLTQDLSGQPPRPYVSLGAYGGYITFKFDHTICNKPAQPDLAIYGNAFINKPTENIPFEYGSSEPGIVMVALDINENGKPDPDEWFELRGSEHFNDQTITNYTITYHKPDPNKAPAASQIPGVSDAQYIKWTDNQNNEGFLIKVPYHTQSYWPFWQENQNTITLHGTLLPNNGETIKNNDGSYLYVQRPYDWGYVDNRTNDNSTFDIGWAADRDGNIVHLPGIDFIRVYTGVRASYPSIGELSTELTGATDLHMINEK